MALTLRSLFVLRTEAVIPASSLMGDVESNAPNSARGRPARALPSRTLHQCTSQTCPGDRERTRAVPLGLRQIVFPGLPDARAQRVVHGARDSGSSEERRV